MFRFRLLTLFLIFSVVAVGVAYFAHRYRTNNEALTSLTVNERGYNDGREVEIHIAGNPLGKSTVVVISDRHRLAINDPLPSLKSDVSLKTHYPPDPSISRVWIDGQEQSIGNGLLVVYASEHSNAETVTIPEEKRNNFLADATDLDPVQFWISGLSQISARQNERASHSTSDL